MLEETPRPAGLEDRVEELEQSQRMLELQRRVLELAALGAPLVDTLDEMCSMIGGLVPKSISSVMELVEDEHGPFLRIIAAPGVPEASRALLNGVRPGSQSGSCGTAAFLGESVIVTDTLTDHRWQPLLPLVEKIGIRACWSIPIKIDGKPVATFAISQDTPQSPSAFQEEILATASHLAGLAFAKNRDHEQLLQSQERVRQLQKFESLGIMAGGIAHDFNNLLTGVLGNAELALNFIEGENPATERIQAIQRAAQGCSDLCTQMLTYAGRGSVTLQECELSGIARDSLEMMSVVLAQRATLDLKLSEERLPIRADQVQVGQVIVNLLMNAADAMGSDGGKIRIATGKQRVTRSGSRRGALSDDVQPGDYAFLEVSDDGHGMTEEVRGRIFDPFFSTRFDGRGLGLASVLGIVKAHDGAIEVHTGPDRGTRFRVLFPTLASGAPSRATAAQPLLDTSRGVVLIADDDPIVRDLARVSFDLMGLEVLEAANGAEAIKAVERGGIDLILLDLTMPLVSGFQVLARVRELNPELPVIVSTGHTTRGSLDELRADPHSTLLSKPYAPSQLREAVENLIG